MHGYRPLSIDCRFVVDGIAPPQLIEARACLTLPPSHDGPREPTHTGFWAQLETEGGDVLHNRHVAGMMTPLGDEPMAKMSPLSDFAVLVPFRSEATHISLFAAPPDASGVRPHLGAPSELVGRYRIPTLAFGDPSEEVLLPSDICGGGRGEVLSVSQIVNHGRIENIHNLIILAEGFLEDEQDKFVKAAHRATNYLLARWPFNSGIGSSSMNVFVVEVASKSDKVNDPEKTYFQAETAEGRGLLSWSTSCVRKVCDALFQRDGLPYWSWAGLMVQGDVRGRSIGRQFAQTSAASAAKPNEPSEVFQHEFGHSAFDLGDEYGGELGVYTGGDPGYPNLTIETEASKIKWNDMITPGVPIPTLGNPSNCDASDGRSNPVADADVGLYAGGAQCSCDIYHPQYHCAMRSSGSQDGGFCVVCAAKGQKVVLQAYDLSAPAPGSLYYSPISRSWSPAVVSPSFLADFGIVRNFARFDEVVAELTGGAPGPAVDAAFTRAGSSVTFRDGATVFQAYYDPDVETGLWYAIQPFATAIGAYYIRGWKVGTSTSLDLGYINFPEFPKLVTIDSAPVGIDVLVFAADDRKLALGRLDNGGALSPAGMVTQAPAGLADDIVSLSVTSLRPRIWVAVVDELKIKIGGYELMSADWSVKGFQETPLDAPVDFAAVKTSALRGEVHVVGASDGGLSYNVFDTIHEAWKGAPAATPVTSEVDLFDVAAIGDSLYLATASGGEIRLYEYGLSSGAWSAGASINDAIGLSTETTITSLGLAGLRTNLHLVILVDGAAQDATMEFSTGSWSPMDPIKNLSPLTYEIAEITLHAEDDRMFMGLSRVT